MIYGHDKTIHQTEHVNVELGPDGKVVAVWFRCTALPFDQTVSGRERAESMIRMYQRPDSIPKLNAVDVTYQVKKHVGFPRSD